MGRNDMIRDACFICSSPYQIIGAIAIAKELALDADIYITGEFPKYDEIARRLRTHRIFADVYTADTKIISGQGKAVSLKMTLLAKRVVAGFMPENVSYKACYASSRSTLKATTMAVLRKRNPNMMRIVFEDGLGMYSDEGSLFKVSRSRRMMERILGWDLDDQSRLKIMTYLPELVTPPAFLKNIPVEQMPRLALNDENRRMLMDIFAVSDEQLIGSRYIVFDTKRRGEELDILSKDEKQRLDSCYEIVKGFARDGIICKPHPKSVEKPACDMAIYPYQSVPMEVLYMGMSDVEERILVSQVSTAVFSPKIFLDKEPVVICLYRLLPENPISQNFDAIYGKFRSTYRRPDRVFAPATIEELEAVLQNL